MKHDFYLLLTSGSSNAGDETHSMRCSATCLRAGGLLSHHLQCSHHAELGRPVKRIQENWDYFREVNSKLKQPVHAVPKVPLKARGTAGDQDRVWALKCRSAIHKTFIT